MGEKTTVKMDKELVKQAHELGLNVSKVCENALKETIKRLKGSNPGTYPNKGKERSAGESVVTRLLFSDDIELSGLPPAFSRHSSAVACPCIPRIGRFIPVGTTSASPHPRASRGVSFLCHCPVSQPCSYEHADLLDGRSFLRLSPGSRPLTRRHYNF